MTLNYGRPADPENYVIGLLMPLGLPVGPERPIEGQGEPGSDSSLPCYVVTAVAGKSNKFMLCATVSVHSMGNSRDQAAQVAWNADNALISVTPWDTVTLPDTSTATAAVECVMPPIWADYRDPYVKRYVARYEVALRFQPAA